MRNKLFIIILFLVIILFYMKYIEYYSQIVLNSYIPDYTRWILSDKYVAKEYAKHYGFKVAKTYQLVKYPHQLLFDRDTCVIKAVDLCDSYGVYLIKNNIDLKTNLPIQKTEIINNLQHIRSHISNEYYMHDSMYNGLIPYSGYMVEELLLDEKGNVPSDYKCYVFGGKIVYTAMTYNRKVINNVQTFNSVWFDRDWNPIKYPMIKKNYKYKKLPKPKSYDKMVTLVENMGSILKRHCRIDVYLIGDNVYLGEFTFFCGARLHSIYSNFMLGIQWKLNPDKYYQDPYLREIVPSYYNKPTI